MNLCCLLTNTAHYSVRYTVTVNVSVDRNVSDNHNHWSEDRLGSGCVCADTSVTSLSLSCSYFYLSIQADHWPGVLLGSRSITCYSDVTASVWWEDPLRLLQQIYSTVQKNYLHCIILYPLSVRAVLSAQADTWSCVSFAKTVAMIWYSFFLNRSPLNFTRAEIEFYYFQVFKATRCQCLFRKMRFNWLILYNIYIWMERSFNMVTLSPHTLFSGTSVTGFTRWVQSLLGMKLMWRCRDDSQRLLCHSASVVSPHTVKYMIRLCFSSRLWLLVCMCVNVVLQVKQLGSGYLLSWAYPCLEKKAF